MNIQVKFPDGSVRKYEAGISVEEVAQSISPSLKLRSVAAKVNDRLVDMSYALQEDSSLELISLESDEGLRIYRHSAAHIMAQAVKRIFGPSRVQLGIGPVIQDGFYYDMDLDRSLTPKDLQNIEKEMQEIIRAKLPIRRQAVSREEAERLFSQMQEPLKLELIRDLPDDEEISIYEQGEFIDLCRGPHLPHTGWLRSFKLMHIAGAYWRGDSKNKMLQRIYGTAFPAKSQLEEHLALLEEAKNRDHRKLGKELGLFMFSEEAVGMPFFLPRGFVIRNELEAYERELQREYGYQEVRTPLLYNQRLWEQSGHWEHYRDNMYFTKVDETDYAVKPMNCPGHMLIYKNDLHSYRDLPVRLAEFGQVHRHEFSGALNGMMRVRTFCQDDAHIFVRPDQIEGEIGRIMELIEKVYGVFGFTYNVEISTRPENSMGSAELWNEAERALQAVLEAKGVAYRINEGDGAFYGPKIDFHILDALKRSWQCGTIQLDFQMPEKFDLYYMDESNRRTRPVVIHRALYGSLERFVGILTEHFAGQFPVWLAPVQAVIIPVSSQFDAYANVAKDRLMRAGARVETDVRNEKLGYKIREAQLRKIPYMLICGEAEASNGTLSVRKRGQGDIDVKSVDEISQMIAAASASKAMKE